MRINRIVVFFQHYYVWCTLTLMVLIASLSLSPLSELPTIPGSDKTHHIVAYATLAIPLSVARPRSWLWGLLGLLSFSGAIELAQPYVNRYGEWADLFANGLGLLVGAIAAHVMLYLNKKNLSG